MLTVAGFSVFVMMMHIFTFISWRFQIDLGLGVFRSYSFLHGKVSYSNSRLVMHGYDFHFLEHSKSVVYLDHVCPLRILRVFYCLSPSLFDPRACFNIEHLYDYEWVDLSKVFDILEVFANERKVEFFASRPFKLDVNLVDVKWSCFVWTNLAAFYHFVLKLTILSLQTFALISFEFE